MRSEGYLTNLPCAVCGVYPVNDLHHIKTRAAFGTDDEWNMMPLCRKHHSMAHTIGSVNMASRFSGYKEFLIQNNWYICELKGNWKHGK